MNVKLKKSLKIVTLLITAVFIATASATTYTYLYQNATISVMNGLVWVEGANFAEANGAIDGPTVTLGMTGIAGSTTIYADPVELENQHATSDITCTVLASITSGDTDWSDMDSLKIAVYDETNPTPQATLTIWDGVVGSDLDIALTIPASEQWRFQWEITWKSDAAPAASVLVALTVTFAAPA